MIDEGDPLSIGPYLSGSSDFSETIEDKSFSFCFETTPETDNMRTSLSAEFSKYYRNMRHVKYLLEETKSCFSSLGAEENVTEKPPIMSAREENELTSILQSPPCIIILGQTRYAKAMILNEIFRMELMPVNDDASSDWRMVRFTFAAQNNITLSIPEDNYELIENLSAYQKPWDTIPVKDLEMSDDERTDEAKNAAIMDVKLNHPVLRDGSRVIVTPCCKGDSLAKVTEVFQRCTSGVTPIFLYGLEYPRLTEADISELAEHRRVSPDVPVFFIRVPTIEEYRKWCRQRPGGLMSHHSHSCSPTPRIVSNHPDATADSLRLFNDLSNLGFLNNFQNSCESAGASSGQWSEGGDGEVPGSPIMGSYGSSSGFSSNESSMSQSGMEFRCPRPPRVLSDLEDNFSIGFPKMTSFVRRCLQRQLVYAYYILFSVHDSVLNYFIQRAFECAHDIIMTPTRVDFIRTHEMELYTTLSEMASRKQGEIRALIGRTLVEKREELLEQASTIEFVGYAEGATLTAREVKAWTAQIREEVLVKLNSSVAANLMDTIQVFRAAYTGTLERCVSQLESNLGTNNTATENLKQILNAAYQVELNVKTGSSFVRNLLEKMKELVNALPWHSPPEIDSEWKRRVAAAMLDSLSEVRLAKSVCEQIEGRLKSSHNAFLSALSKLESRALYKTGRSKESRERIRSMYAPRVARLALESVSMRDLILYGLPQTGRELGRGQYGVVFSSEPWANRGQCAVKSVVPPDERHWNDLALEYYYTKSLPKHERIVQMFGSVIDYSYGGGGHGPQVLLVMERMTRDLHTAIKQNLSWRGRLQVAVDVVQGIRFLHKQGLIHRDIKLKNVLLDTRNRAKLSDLGFCKPHAMMSGSIVGTPVHMAPELLLGEYDASVDVYAFGILFWYICANQVNLPRSLRDCASKDMLWSAVKRGLRPERLPSFTDVCWQLMSDAWHGEPYRRPLPGEIEQRLEEIRGQAETVTDVNVRVQDPSAPLPSFQGTPFVQHGQQ